MTRKEIERFVERCEKGRVADWERRDVVEVMFPKIVRELLRRLDDVERAEKGENDGTGHISLRGE